MEGLTERKTGGLMSCWNSGEFGISHKASKSPFIPIATVIDDVALG